MKKFNLGDLVRFTKRAPIWVKGEKPSRSYRITSIFFDQETQSTRYYVGKYDYPFRSYMLKLASGDEPFTIGRPKTKRRYVKHRGRRKKARV